MFYSFQVLKSLVKTNISVKREAHLNSICFVFQVSIDDDLPKVVCEDCFFKLDQLFDFREKSLQAEGIFVEMLKVIGKDDLMSIEGHGQSDSENITVLQAHLPNEDAQPVIHSIQVMNQMDLEAGEHQVIADNQIRVSGIECLDGDTVRMVNEHIRQVICRLSQNNIRIYTYFLTRESTHFFLFFVLRINNRYPIIK